MAVSATNVAAPINLGQAPTPNDEASFAATLFQTNVQRYDIMQDNLKDVLKGVQDRNRKLEGLTAANQKLTAMKNLFPPDAKPDDGIGRLTRNQQDEYSRLMDDLTTIGTNYNITLPTLNTFSSLSSTSDVAKAQIDSLSNANQMDLLRMQQLKNNSDQALSRLS